MKKRSLYDRLTYTFGTDRVHNELQHFVSRYRRDPLESLTEDAQQELFQNLLRDYKRTKRMNAANRRIYRERRNA